MSDISRRKVAQGALWSAPAIVVAAASPAVAASLQPVLSVSGRVSYNEDYDGSLDGTNQFKVFSTSGDAPGAGYCVQNTTSSTTLSDFVVTYYIATDQLAFSAGSYGTNGWSMLTRNTSIADKTGADGETYYAYTTTYSGTYPASDGTTCWPQFDFESDTDVRDNTQQFYVNNSVTINGSATTANYGPIAMSAASN